MTKSESIPLISVLMPVYNAELYLDLAITSILDQDFQEYELIAINDGSKDRSAKILNDYADRDPRIRVIHRVQRGIVASLNEGIDLARGKWIARMDADDIALQNRFNLQLDLLNRTDSDFCGGAVECFGSSCAVWYYPETNEGCGVQLLFGVPVAHPAVIGRTSAFKALRYDSNYEHAEDYDLWQRAWASGFKFVNLKNVVLRYRVHKNQISFRQIASQRIMADAVRARQWLYVCPGFGCEEIISSMFSRNDMNPILLSSAMTRALSQIPKTEHGLFLRLSLAIFVRRAKHDSRVICAWIQLCKASSANALYTRLFGILELLLLSLFRLDPDGPIFTWLRTNKNLIKPAPIFTAIGRIKNI